MLHAVESDIKKREELLNYVFESRRADEAGGYPGQIQENSSETTSLMISAITTSALQTAN